MIPKALSGTVRYDSIGSFAGVQGWMRNCDLIKGLCSATRSQRQQCSAMHLLDYDAVPDDMVDRRVIEFSLMLGQFRLPVWT